MKYTAKLLRRIGEIDRQRRLARPCRRPSTSGYIHRSFIQNWVPQREIQYSTEALMERADSIAAQGK